MTATKRLGLAGLLAAAMLAALPAGASPWSEVVTPAPGPARAIGEPAKGCLAGAVALPADGPGFETIRLSRRRYFGHPDTVAFVERLGRSARAAGLEPFYVGDMAQPRGGPLPSGHASHQTGIDVDIWFNLDPKPDLLAAQREEVALPSMVLPDQRAVDPAHFGAPQVRLLRLAASDPAVDRIFVHWTIKRALCAGFGGAGQGDRFWLHRLRPWYGHDDHFHVRLHCPQDSPDCRPQPPVPEGDGCDASLDWWFRQPRPQAAPSPAPRRLPVLPAQCRKLIGGP